MAKRLAVTLCSSCLALAWGCASTPNPYEDEVPQEVELLVSNERQSVVTAYYQWQQGSPVRLGEIEGGSMMMTRVPVRGQELRVFFVSAGVSPGNPNQPEYASARAGDRFEWTLRADRSVYYLRIPSE